MQNYTVFAVIALPQGAIYARQRAACCAATSLRVSEARVHLGAVVARLLSEKSRPADVFLASLAAGELEDGTLFMVTEFMAGGDLSTVLWDTPPLPWGPFS